MTTGDRPRGWALLRRSLAERKTATMLGFGFSSGLPYALLVGTLTAWLGEVGIKLSTIGVFAWIALAYSFKFLWSPAVDRVALPGLGRLGRRRSWILLCQLVLAAAFAGLAATDPTAAIGRFALIAFVGALASATQDIAVDAWRIDVADERAPVELLSAIYQFGYRLASIVGGAFALVLAARMSWGAVYLTMGAVVAAAALVTLAAPDTPRPPTAAALAGLHGAGELDRPARTLALAVVGAGWLWAIATIVRFMVAVLDPPAGAAPPAVGDFTRTTGPPIVAATVLLPLAVAALANRRARGRAAPAGKDARSALDPLYLALVAPLAELTARLGPAVLGVLGLIFTYSLSYNIWSTFAFPFYLDFMHYSKDEVAFASKLFGVGMTILGIATGGYLFARVGRMPTVLLGALLPIAGNLVFADLADGGRWLDAFARPTGLRALGAALGSSDRMVRLLLAISVENVTTGIAGAAFVAYLSGIVSKRYTAVQYALLSSLTFLVGSLLKPVAGELFERLGYAPVFRLTALAGLVAGAFVLAEWARVSRAARRSA